MKPLLLTERDEKRFWSKVALPNEQGCMLWLSQRGKRDGYGRFSLAGLKCQAHRVAYTLAYGPVPEGLEVDHLCRVRHCVAPLHLEAVTHAVNTSRGSSPAAANTRKTHCPAGHPYAGGNLHVSTKGTRHCRECRKLHARRYRATAASLA